MGAGMKTITFTKAQAAAVLHRMECGDCIAEVFNDTDHLMHMADAVEARAFVLATELTATGCVTIDPTSELDTALMLETIEGSTWVAVHDNTEVSRQALSASEQTLKTAAATIECAFDLPAGSIEVPEV